MAGRRKHQKPPVDALPGSGDSCLPPGMHSYVVNLTPLVFPRHPRPERSQVVQAYAAQSAEFFRRLREVLAKRGWEDQVAGFGEAGGLPVVTLTCTPAVAKLIEQLPGVTGVYADDSGSFALMGPVDRPCGGSP